MRQMLAPLSGGRWGIESWLPKSPFVEGRWVDPDPRSAGEAAVNHPTLSCVARGCRNLPETAPGSAWEVVARRGAWASRLVDLPLGAKWDDHCCFVKHKERTTGAGLATATIPSAPQPLTPGIHITHVWSLQECGQGFAWWSRTLGTAHFATVRPPHGRGPPGHGAFLLESFGLSFQHGRFLEGQERRAVSQTDTRGAKTQQFKGHLNFGQS